MGLLIDGVIRKLLSRLLLRGGEVFPYLCTASTVGYLFEVFRMFFF
jgi:hypothetical protein